MKSYLGITLALATCFAFTTLAAAAPGTGRSKSTPKHSLSSKSINDIKQKVTLEIVGADSSKADGINKALADHSFKAKLHEGKGKNKQLHLTAELDRGADLSQWSKVVAEGVAAPKGQPGPLLQLVIYAPLTKESSTQAMAELEKVKGVDIKHTTADVKNGELRVGLSGTESVTAEQISMAVQAAGVTGHLTKAKAPKTT